MGTKLKIDTTIHSPATEYINIYISSDTLCISSIENNIISPAKVIIKPGASIYLLFKTFKPVYADYPALNALLTDFKMLNRLETEYYYHNPVTFKNNNNFLDNIIQFVDIKCNEFIVTIINKNIITIKPVIPLHTHEHSILLDDLGRFNPVIIKHELANSLNIINMSSILLNSGLHTITGKPETVTKLDKYSQIIKTELENTISLLNTVNKLTTDTSSDIDDQINPISSKVKLDSFYNFIIAYLTDINKLYPIYEDGHIYIENPECDSIIHKYINIQLPWVKIILDNIFKNIYGHLGNKTNKKFRSIDLTYNNELQQLIINIYNEILPDFNNNVTKCELYTELQDKYNLINSEHEIIPCKQQNTNQGLNLINTLCSKLNITWSLIEVSDSIYLFKLAIPVYNSAIGTYSRDISSLMCRRDYSSKTNNKYNIYLNDRISQLHTTTI